MRFLSFLKFVRCCTNLPHVGSYTSLTVLDYSDTCFREELNPESKEMISDSVELCETEIQLIGTKVMASENAQCSTWCRFWILKISCKNLSLEIVPVCIVLQYYPHGNTVCTHMCDECMRSNDIIVCHRLWSILWSIVQVWSPTIEYQVFQYVPSFSISEQFESILFTILPRIAILLLWNDGHQCMELILCRVVESFCSPTYNIFPQISWHDPPCHVTTKKYADFPSMVTFQLLRRKFWIQTWFCNCPQYLSLFHSVFEYTPDFHDWFSQINFFIEYFPHRIHILFLSSQFDVIHIHG